MNIERIVNRAKGEKGISLIEVAIIIVAVGILASLVLQSMSALLKDARQVETEREMDMLAKAIAGDPSIMAVAGGERSEFGYVGDIGALPPNLDALVTNPGYSTWHGPYIPPSFNTADNDFKKDAWGVDYTYTGGVTITSTGSDSSIVKQFAESSDDLLLNSITGLIRDINDSLPTPDDAADIDVVIIYPDGTGGLDTNSYHPDDSGWFSLTSLPIGRHQVHVIYTPEVDTLTRYVTVVPRNGDDQLARYNFDTSYFSQPDTSACVGLTFVEGSDTAYGAGGYCHCVSFWLANNSGASIQIDWVVLEYSTTAYYQVFDYGADGDYEFAGSSPRNGSSDTVTFTLTETVANGGTSKIEVETFIDVESGTGNKVDMSTTTFTVTFSDGSTFDVAMSGYCD
ncbi:MAG: hypothetical protein JSV52_07175 [Candidatus Zixiibacteriota bacterium]|nr:MAG: hypothetical protein JSV52_07175 [candidate division Zixibacteria bacterium]